MKLIFCCFAAILLFGLASCTSAPPSVAEIKQKVVNLLGIVATPDAPGLDIMVEPTGVRWTFLRNHGSKTQSDSANQGREIVGPLPDSLIGITFGHGLFLDSQGNLSLLPLSLWPTHWSIETKYTAVVTQDIWSNHSSKPIDFKRTQQGFAIYKPSLLGPNMQTIDLQNRMIRSLDFRVDKNPDGSWSESNPLQLFSATHIYQKKDLGITHTIKNFLESSVSYTSDGNGVQSADARFSVVLDNDHWKISDDQKEWQLYFGNEKALLIDVQTGQTALMTAQDTGANLKCSQGNIESIVPAKD